MREPTKEEFTEILNEYTAKCVLPDVKTKKPYAIAPVGFIGSGKTTVIKKLAKELNAVFISGDEIRALYVDRKISYYNVLIETELSVAKTFLEKGYSIAIDNDCAGFTGPAVRDQMGVSGFEIVWVHINTSEDQCIKNIRKRGTNVFHANVDDLTKWFHKRKDKFHTEPYNVDFTCVFSGNQDFTDKEVDECVKNISKRFDK